MTLEKKVQEAIIRLNPKFDELADGYADFIEVDEKRKIAKVRFIGGKLHRCGDYALGLWVEKLLKEEVPELNEVIDIR
jgi:Fe-S cluster biogenesis protein NfuA